MYVTELFAKDYHVQVVDNVDGSICQSYPVHLLIVEEKEKKKKNDGDENKEKKMQHKSSNGVVVKESNIGVEESLKDVHLKEESMKTGKTNCEKLKELFVTSRFARAHGRFVVPVLPVNGKQLCRSSTISIGAETVLNAGTTAIVSYVWGTAALQTPSVSNDSSFQQFWPENVRSADVELLEELRVKYIFDLMVENNKKFYGMSICSSEKVDVTGAYRDFSLNAIPFPGCEFFKDYYMRKDSGAMHYDWSLPLVESSLKLSSDYLVPFENLNFLNLNWAEWRSWSLETLTSNYVLVILNLLSPSMELNERSGVLVHCISGWDRTPLFVSLLRLSLWADGIAHASLNSEEILYLTLAYDWFLFGHQFFDRRVKREDILYFCFDFLPALSDSTYSMQKPTPIGGKSVVGPGQCLARIASHDSFVCVNDSPFFVPSSEPISLAATLPTLALAEGFTDTLAPSCSESLNISSEAKLESETFALPSFDAEYLSNGSFHAKSFSRKAKLEEVSKLFKKIYHEVFVEVPIDLVKSPVAQSDILDAGNFGISNLVSWATSALSTVK